MICNLQNMFPCMPVNNISDIAGCNSELTTEYSGSTTLSMKLADASDFGIRKLSHVRALTTNMSVLADTILDVIVIRAQEQMDRIYTWWVVALMQYFQVFGINAEMKVVRNPMCSPLQLGAIIKHHPVTLASMGLPLPAHISGTYDEVFPKASKYGWRNKVNSFGSRISVWHAGLLNRSVCYGPLHA